MKGFPNQIADLSKIALGMKSLVSMVNSGINARDDGVFGEALVRVGVAGTGHRPLPVDDYIRRQLEKPESNQSFRTTARGLRELYRLLGLIDDSEGMIQITSIGTQAASYANTVMNDEQIEFWRTTIRNIIQSDRGGRTSHPYQVLLRLIGQRPGITRAKCALALEAADDSPEELTRIVAIADLPEKKICALIGVTKSNWDNAKKVLPAFAEQLNDVIREGHTFKLADAPGRADAGIIEEPRLDTRIRTPRTSRAVTFETIGRAGTGDRLEGAQVSRGIDAAAATATNKLRFDRLRRHNLIVKELASHFPLARLFEEPFDLLVLSDGGGLLVEVKTLDGTASDEKDRVRDALAQLLYYEAFVATPVVGDVTIDKVACFESPISAAHKDWLNQSKIAVIWKMGNDFEGDESIINMLGNR